MITLHSKKYFVLLLGGILTCCSEPEVKENKIEIRTPSPITLAVGDTSEILILSKTITEANGRTTTTNPYHSFSLTVNDTSIATVVNLQRLVGRVPGETTVKARDEKSSLVSAAVTVRVVAKP